MSHAGSGHGRALARVALAGNPSDLHAGAVLAVTVDLWGAHARATRSSRPAVQPPSRLVDATRERFAREHHPGGARAAIAWSTTIPRSVGLGGSSAIVIATTRALCELLGVRLEPAELAWFALKVETEELGIVAGPQDRVAQAYQGLLFMNFGEERSGPLTERLDSALLPELLLAWRSDAAADSGQIHAAHNVPDDAGGGRAEAVRELAAAARMARDALLDQDTPALCAAIGRTFQLRPRIAAVDARTAEMIEWAQAAGAAANSAGSAGAIVAVCALPQTYHDVRRELARRGCATAGIPAGSVSDR